MEFTVHAGRSTLIGHRAPSSPAATRRDLLGDAELACVCALCTCGRHSCPQHPPAVPFDGTTTHREHYPPKRLGQPCPVPDSLLDTRWKPRSPVKDPLLQSIYAHDYPGHTGPGARGLGLPLVKPASVPFLGRTTYQSSYTPKKAELDAAMTDVALPASTVALDGRTTHATDFPAYAHLPATDYVPPADSGLPSRRPARVPAHFEGESAYSRDYPPWPGTRPPQSFKRPDDPLEPYPFAGTTTYRELHDRKKIPTDNVSLRPGRGEGYRIPAETRDFSTTTAREFVPKPIAADTVCPASRLPRPPSPSQAPQAWEHAQGQDHVLWDTTRGEWAV